MNILIELLCSSWNQNENVLNRVNFKHLHLVKSKRIRINKRFEIRIKYLVYIIMFLINDLTTT